MSDTKKAAALLWYRPTYSRSWHIITQGQYSRLTACRTWGVPSWVTGSARDLDEPDNCPACVRVHKGQESHP